MTCHILSQLSRMEEPMGLMQTDKQQLTEEQGLQQKKKIGFIERMKDNRDKYSWADVAGVLANIITLAAYCTISPALAKYQGTDILLSLAKVSIIVMLLILFWEILCILGGTNGTVLLIRERMWLVTPLLALLIASCSFLCWYFQPISTQYYVSITEVYGVPTGAGEPLPPEELENQPGYWRVEDDPRRKCITLTYIDPYNQLELMKENSSAYGMSIFSTPARIVCDYITDQEEYRRRLDAETFTAASDAGILRMPKTTSYYSSSGKLLLRLEQSSYGKAEIVVCSVEDMPQLLNSTLLRIPDDQSAVPWMTSLQIETVYRPDGLAESRRIAPYIYNKYGVNGERYSYNEKGQIVGLCYFDVNEQLVCNKLGIMSIKFGYEEEGGPLRSVRYFSNENGTEKIEGFHGVFCEKFKYDNGFLQERQQLNRSENWCYDKNQVCRYRYTYKDNQLIQEEFLGRENTSVQNSQFKTSSLFYHLKKEEQQEWLTVSFGTMSDVAQDMDVPVPPIWRKTVLEDTISGAENSNYTGAKQDDTNGNNQVCTYSAVCYQIGAKDRHLLSISYWNGDVPAVNEQGCAQKHFEYDNQNRTECTFYCNVDGQPCSVLDGYAGIKRTYQNEFGDKLKELQYLGLDGETPVMNREEGYAVVQYEYATHNQLETVHMSYFYYDKEKKKLLPSNTNGYAVEKITYDERGFLIQKDYRDEHDAPAYHNDYQVSSIFYEYSDDGELILEYYRDAENVAANRADTGHAMIHQEFEAGNLVKRSYEGYQDGKLQPLPDWTTGAVEICYFYENGRNTRTEYRDAKGELILRNDTGYAIREVTYNSNGDICEQCFYGKDGEPVLRWGHNYFRQMNWYNPKGQLQSVRYYGINEEPVINTYYHCAGSNYGYDDYGNRNKTEYLDPDGKLMIRSDLGYAQVERTYKNGNIIEAVYFDTNGNRVACKDGGYASYKSNYENGNWVESRYYDTKGQPMICSDRGYTIVKNTYDDLRQMILQEYFAIDPDTNEEIRVVSSKWHCAGFRYEYDSMGNLKRIEYLGIEDGELMIRSNLGYAMMEQDYDKGKLVAEHYFDTQGQPILAKDEGYASFKAVYEKGRWMESRYYDTEGNPTLRADRGFAIVKNEYDEFGKKRRICYYGIDEKPIISSYFHCAGFEYDYDTLDNLYKIRYLGMDDKLMVRSDLGYAQIERIYDHGEIVNEAYLDKEGYYTPQKEGGFASFKAIYKDGLLVENCFFNTRGEPMIETEKGYAYIKNTYNPAGQKISSRFYGTDGETLMISNYYHSAGFDYQYDAKGNQEYVYYIGLDGEQMTENDLGYVQVKKYYDDVGQLVGEDYLDANGKYAVNHTGGHSAYWDTYENGQWVQTVYYDAQEKPLVHQAEGYAILRNTYDSQGRRKFQRYYDIDGKTYITSGKYHSSGFRRSYDERGNLTHLLFYDSDEIVTLQPGEHLLNYMEYDQRDHRIWNGYYIWNEEQDEYTLVIRNDLGYAAIEHSYDKTLWTGTRYLDENCNPVISEADGYAIMEREYNHQGQLYKVTYRDAEGNLTKLKDGYAMVEYKYDDSGNNNAWVYYDRFGLEITW